MFVKNATQFTATKLKLLNGSVPKQIKGTFYRNGPGLFNFGAHVINHLFYGDGYVLKLDINNGDITAQGKFVQTSLYKKRIRNNSFQNTFFENIKWLLNIGIDTGNPCNTSVLILDNRPEILALSEGGKPFLMKKNNLDSIGFTNFNWIKSRFSAHYKCDPENGDIFNIGLNAPFTKIMKCNKNMQIICEKQFKMKKIQSIHDFCLAGDYLVLFEYPINFNVKDFLLKSIFFYSCLTLDQKLPTLVHIFKKDNLEHIKTVQIDPFFSFHFTNGYSTQSKIVIEYVKYDLQSTKNLFRVLQDIPKYSQPNFKGQYPGNATIDQFTIELKDFTIKTTQSIKMMGEFPICSDEEVGKQWQYTYAIGSQTNNFFHFDSIYKYDRLKGQLDRVQVKGDGNIYLNQPCLIRTSQKLYIKCIVNKNNKSYVHMYTADRLQLVCQLQLPVFVPLAFHGKWKNYDKNEVIE